jgi:hypothetical protein
MFVSMLGLLPIYRGGASRLLCAKRPASDFHLPALAHNGAQKDKILGHPADRFTEP